MFKKFLKLFLLLCVITCSSLMAADPVPAADVSEVKINYSILKIWEPRVVFAVTGSGDVHVTPQEEFTLADEEDLVGNNNYSFDILDKTKTNTHVSTSYTLSITSDTWKYTPDGETSPVDTEVATTPTLNLPASQAGLKETTVTKEGNTLVVTFSGLKPVNRNNTVTYNESKIGFVTVTWDFPEAKALAGSYVCTVAITLTSNT